MTLDRKNPNHRFDVRLLAHAIDHFKTHHCDQRELDLTRPLDRAWQELHDAFENLLFCIDHDAMVTSRQETSSTT